MMNIFKSILVILISINISFAFTVNCDVKTNLESDKQSFNAEISDAGHGDMEFFETTHFNGLVSSAKGYLVIGLTLKSTQQSISLHSKITDGVLGGQFIDGDNWIQISCSQE